MPLAPGVRLGAYEILVPIGAGGMGEVYRARDTILKREVALKVLPEAFARDPERMARFQREAEMLASLNHPNIAAIYGVTESESARALVMEMVEGDSPKGPLPFDEAWHIATQMAAALEYAHEKGIVHRDLKPANIKITPEGVVKLLDFGLAKAFTNPEEGRSSGSNNVENSPTLTIGATEVGMILGTAAYMAPEQARGKAVDKRADIWSFGVVLYELLTGERLFRGEEVADTLAHVLTKQPDFDSASARVRPLLRACLEKDPRSRLRDIGDARRLLRPDVPVSEGAGSASSLSRPGRVGWIAAAGLAVVAAVAGAGWWRATRPAELKPLVRLDVDIGTDTLRQGLGGANAILSPDGTRLAFVSQEKLFTRRLDQPKAIELVGTEGASSPFFSPDGRSIGFFAQGKLRAISLEGGAAVTLCDSLQARGGSWGEDGNIIASLSTYGALSRIPASGGAPSPLTELAAGEITHRWPQILPGGKAVLFTAHTLAAGFDAANIDIVSLADHRRKTLQRGGTFGRYLPGLSGTGHLVYINKGTLFAVPFDPEKLEVRGTPSPVLEKVAYASIDGAAQFDFSRDGTLVYRTGEVLGGNAVTIQWLDAAGKTQALLAKPGIYERPHISPDGERLAFDDSSDIWVYEARRDTMTRLTFDGARNITPVWSPDGRYILFSGVGGIWWVRSDAANTPQLLIKSKNPLYPFSFAHDGKRLAYNQVNPGTSYDILTATIESDGTGLQIGKPEIFLQTLADDRTPTFSPGGRWMAYTSNESGKYEVYVRAFPDKGRKWQISNAGGAYPVWSPNGQELYFRTEDNRIMVVQYAGKPDSFMPDKPRVWSEKRLADLGAIGTSNYDLAPDGKRIVALMPVEGPEAERSQSHVIFLQNFGDELQRKVPPGK